MKEIKFALHLNLSESYIYGKATLNGKDYSINIQQAAKQMIVLPPDFSHIGELDKALISFSKDNDNNDKKISVPSEYPRALSRVCFCKAPLSQTYDTLLSLLP